MTAAGWGGMGLSSTCGTADRQSPGQEHLHELARRRFANGARLADSARTQQLAGDLVLVELVLRHEERGGKIPLHDVDVPAWRCGVGKSKIGRNQVSTWAVACHWACAAQPPQPPKPPKNPNPPIPQSPTQVSTFAQPGSSIAGQKKHTLLALLAKRGLARLVHVAHLDKVHGVGREDVKGDP